MELVIEDCPTCNKALFTGVGWHMDRKYTAISRWHCCILQGWHINLSPKSMNFLEFLRNELHGDKELALSYKSIN